MKVYVESMTKVNHGKYAIRCWRREKGAFNPSDNYKDINNALGKWDGTKGGYTIAQTLLKIKRMNAVEVVDHTGKGIVLYKNWP